MASKLSLFLAELKRRKVYRVATVYVVAGAGIIGLCEAALPGNVWDRLQVPVGVIILVGLPIALILAWAYELKPEEPRPSEPPAEMVVPSPEPATPTAVTAEEKRKSIVVLPFDNMSPDPGDAYFSDGLTEEITSHLSCCGMIRVISRNSAMALKDTRKDTRTIGRELNVQCVLEGSVRRAGDDLRIMAQLIDAGTDLQLWTETYHGTLQDVFDIQEKVARSIVDALTLRLTPEEEKRLSERPTDDITAYECYLQARQEYWRMTPEGLENAYHHVQNGLEHVGENELLFATMGYVAMQRINLGISPGPEHLPEAEKWVGKVFSLNPESPHGHALLGWIRYKQGRVQEGVEHLKRAVEGDPNNVEATAFLAIVYLAAGQVEAAGPVVARLLAIDPLTPINHSLKGYWLFMRRQVPEALASYRRVFDMDPRSPLARVLFARILALAGEEEQANGLLAQIPEESRGHIFAEHGVILSHLLNGRFEEAGAAITPEVVEASRYDEHLSWWMAGWYALLGRKEEAVEWLRHASEIGFLNYPMVSELDRFLDGVRSDPGYLEFAEELRVRWEAFEV